LIYTFGKEAVGMAGRYTGSYLDRSSGLARRSDPG
jgi:hypothetical protein